MNNIIDFYQFRRQKKIKKFHRFIVFIGVIIIFFVFAYAVIGTEVHHPTEFPSYIEPKL
ncbi:hypothetical protein [Priestia megaterium]|uniref:hypothetical protein n=1 Tax=Priestia megaterium TaxID=1404 RepID=UPI000A701D35|nr:hypothetical protein [Priestia megaterium]